MIEIDPWQLRDRLASDRPPLLIDCREADEWALCRIEGARHVPLSRFPELIGPALSGWNDEIVIYCAHGYRSKRAARYLEARGSTVVASLRGGLKAWASAFDPSMQVD